MHDSIVISGLGVLTPGAVDKNAFYRNLENGASAFGSITHFDPSEFPVKTAAEINNIDFSTHLDKARIRNLDRNALLLLVAAKRAMQEAGLSVSEANTDEVGVCTGTTFSHLWSIYEFDKEVFTEGLDFASPAYFPSTVLNAASSHVSIYFNIQGFNATINTGYTSCLEALKYGINCLKTGKAAQVLVGCVETLSYAAFWGFNKIGFMAGLKGEAVSCPFDKRRNGPLLGEAAVMLVVETEENCRKRGAKPLCRILSVDSHFDAFRIGKIHPKAEGLKTTIRRNLETAKMGPGDIDYISSCANSSKDTDRMEIAALKEIFGNTLSKIPLSSVKSMYGETMAASGGLQIASVIAALEKDFLPPTINYKVPDPEINIDCVPNRSQKKEIKTALIDSFGPGGYNSSLILGKIN